MSSYIQLLPEEIIQNIFKEYYNQYIISMISNKCFRKYTVGGKSNNRFKCNLRTIDSAFCMHCHAYKFN